MKEGRRHPHSLRVKLTVSSIAMVALGIVIATCVSVMGIQYYLSSNIDNELMSGREGVESAQLTLDEAVALATIADISFGKKLSPDTARTVTGQSSVLVLLDANGAARAFAGQEPNRIQRELADAVDEPRDLLGPDGPYDVTADGTHYRATAVRLSDGELVLMAISTEAVAATIGKVVKLELAAGAVLITILGFATSHGARRRLRPLEDMVETATAIAEGSPDAHSLSRRVAARRETVCEVEQLRNALNAMLHQVEAAFITREHAAEQLRRFVADASHELRTPLSAIRGYLQLYDKGMFGDSAERERALIRMIAETERMARLVDELLALARLDQRPQLRPRPVALAAVIHEAAADLSVQQPDRPLELELDEDCLVLADEPVLRQIVGNLLGNVRVHTPQTAAVRISVVREGDHGVLRVADDGPGMAPEDADRIFDRFFRAGGTEGSGLGMSVVQAGAEAQNGSAWVTTAPGAGLAVTVTLPAAEAADAAQTCLEASSTTVMSASAPTRTGGPQAPAPRVT